MKQAIDLSVPIFVAMALLFGAAPAWAHCDSLDGPVISDARIALHEQRVAPVLKWVRAEDESLIKETFAQALEVRDLGGTAREVADKHFFETLVRIHRAGEGAPFTGLKTGGTPVAPGIAAADESLESGSLEALEAHLAGAVREALRARHLRVEETRQHADESVASGREYVAAYVEFIHYVEGLVEAVAGHGGHHGEDAQQPEATHRDEASGASPLEKGVRPNAAGVAGHQH